MAAAREQSVEVQNGPEVKINDKIKLADASVVTVTRLEPANATWSEVKTIYYKGAIGNARVHTNRAAALPLVTHAHLSIHPLPHLYAGCDYIPADAKYELAPDEQPAQLEVSTRLRRRRKTDHGEGGGGGNTEGAPEVVEEDDLAASDHPARQQIGAEVRRHFPTSGWAIGTVRQIYLDESGEPLFHAKYPGDDDAEDLNQAEFDAAKAEFASPDEMPPCLRQVSVRQ